MNDQQEQDNNIMTFNEAIKASRFGAAMWHSDHGCLWIVEYFAGEYFTYHYNSDGNQDWMYRYDPEDGGVESFFSGHPYVHRDHGWEPIHQLGPRSTPTLRWHTPDEWDVVIDHKNKKHRSEQEPTA